MVTVLPYIKDNRNHAFLSILIVKGSDFVNNFEYAVVDRKIINVTGKRQVTIPLKFYNKLSFGKEVECFLTEDSIVIRPLSNSDDGFTMEILRDLISQGYSGEELLVKFAERRENISKVVGLLIEEADDIATGKRKGASTKDIFGEDCDV